MATTVTQNINLSVSGQVLGSGSLVNPGANINFATLINAALTSGTGAGKVNQAFYETITLASGATTTLDLYAWGGAKDAAGNAITMATIKLLIIQVVGGAIPLETEHIVVGAGGSSAAWTSYFVANTDSATIPTGGMFFVYNPGATGYVVGASTTNHTLLLTAGTTAGPLTINIYAVGATA